MWGSNRSSDEVLQTIDDMKRVSNMLLELISMENDNEKLDKLMMSQQSLDKAKNKLEQRIIHEVRHLENEKVMLQGELDILKKSNK